MRMKRVGWQIVKHPATYSRLAVVTRYSPAPAVGRGVAQNRYSPRIMPRPQFGL